MNPLPEKKIVPDLPDTTVWEGAHETGSQVDLLALVRTYVSRWPFLLGSLVLGSLLFYGLSYLVRPTFQSDAVFLPPEQHNTLADTALAALWTVPSTGAIYPGLIDSRSVVDMVIRDLNLQAAYRAPDLESTRTILRSRTHVSSDTGGFFHLGVEDRDPEMARKIADAYLRSLMQVNSRLAVDAASQQQSIFERELTREKDALEAAQVALARAQESSGVVSPQSQTQAGLTAIDQLRAQIQAREVELAALRQSETEVAPGVMRLRSQIGALQSQLASMERGSGGGAGAGLSASRAPSVNLEFLRLQREVQYHQSLYDVTTRQFESASMQARAAAPGVQIVDYPETPSKKSFPRRRMWALAGAALCFVLAFLLVFIRERARAIAEVPERRAAMLSVQDAFRHPSWTP